MNDKEILQAAKEIKEKEAKRKKQEYTKQYDKKNYTTKTIKFSNIYDSDIIEQINNIDIPFSIYIKNLIKEDIRRNKKEV